MTKYNFWRTGLFQLTVCSPSLRGVKARSKAEDRVAYYLPLHGLLSLLLLAHRNLPSGDTIHSTAIINQENAAQACLQLSLVGPFSQPRLPISK